MYCNNTTTKGPCRGRQFKKYFILPLDVSNRRLKRKNTKNKIKTHVCSLLFASWWKCDSEQKHNKQSRQGFRGPNWMQILLIWEIEIWRTGVRLPVTSTGRWTRKVIQTEPSICSRPAFTATVNSSLETKKRKRYFKLSNFPNQLFIFLCSSSRSWWKRTKFSWPWGALFSKPCFTEVWHKQMLADQ